MRYTFLALTIISFAGLWSGCASTDNPEANTIEASFKSAEELEKDERYEEAIAKYGEIKSKNPYSRFAVEAELKIADIHFKREAYIEAETAYQLFKDFHPKHPKIDYVTFRLGLSYFNDLPTSIDRDLGPATKAIQFFDEVINFYSTSQYVKEAKEKREAAYRMLAEKEAYIGHFYFKREMYDSAGRRFEALLAKYPGHGLDEEALYRAGVSAFEIGDKEKGAKHLKTLIERFPKSKWVSDARSALEKYGRR